MENESTKQKQTTKYSIPLKFLYGSDESIDIIVDKFQQYMRILLLIKLCLLVLYFGFKMFDLVQYAGYSTAVRQNWTTIAIAVRLTLSKYVISIETNKSLFLFCQLAILGVIFFLIFFIFVSRYNRLGTQIVSSIYC